MPSSHGSSVGTSPRGRRSSPPQPAITDARSQPLPKRFTCRSSCSLPLTRRRPSWRRSAVTAPTCTPRGATTITRRPWPRSSQATPDGLGGNSEPGTITFGFMQRFVDRIVTGSEADLKSAVLGLVEAEHLIAEAAGAAGIAALIGRRIEEVRDRHVVVIVTGSNIDRDRLKSLL